MSDSHLELPTQLRTPLQAARDVERQALLTGDAASLDRASRLREYALSRSTSRPLVEPSGSVFLGFMVAVPLFCFLWFALYLLWRAL